jgi:hypothetical protein
MTTYELLHALIRTTLMIRLGLNNSEKLIPDMEAAKALLTLAETAIDNTIQHIAERENIPPDELGDRLKLIMGELKNDLQ